MILYLGLISQVVFSHGTSISVRRTKSIYMLGGLIAEVHIP
jgi:hypothetical protein